jgi:hypothetical protein
MDAPRLPVTLQSAATRDCNASPLSVARKISPPAVAGGSFGGGWGQSGGHGTRTRNRFPGTTFPVWPLAIRLPSEKLVFLIVSRRLGPFNFASPNDLGVGPSGGSSRSVSSGVVFSVSRFVLRRRWKQIVAECRRWLYPDLKPTPKPAVAHFSTCSKDAEWGNATPVRPCTCDNCERPPTPVKRPALRRAAGRWAPHRCPPRHAVHFRPRPTAMPRATRGGVLGARCRAAQHPLLRLLAVGDNSAMEAEPPKVDSPKRKRRRFQFRPWKPMILTLICAVAADCLAPARHCVVFYHAIQIR